MHAYLSHFNENSYQHNNSSSLESLPDSAGEVGGLESLW